jgi:uncharacterized membrane protein YoaK (UPF0700 family)
MLGVLFCRLMHKIFWLFHEGTLLNRSWLLLEYAVVLLLHCWSGRPIDSIALETLAAWLSLDQP